MTEENLTRANKIQKEIRELETFIFQTERTWTGKLIKRSDFYIFKSNSYGMMDSAELNLNATIKNKVLDVLREYLNSLKKQLSNL